MAALRLGKRTVSPASGVGVAARSECPTGNRRSPSWATPDRRRSGVASLPRRDGNDSGSGGGGCGSNDDCDAGQVCVGTVCETLCASDSQCADGEACIERICQRCSNCRDVPDVVSVNGTGTADGGDHAANHVLSSLVLEGTNLEGVGVELSGGNYSNLDLEICDATASSVQVDLPSDIVPGTYTLNVANQAGSCTADITLLQGEQGPPGAYAIGTGLSESGGTLSVDFGTTAGTAAEGNDARFHTPFTSADVLQTLIDNGWVPNLLVNPGFELTQTPGGNRSSAALWYSSGTFVALDVDSTPTNVTGGTNSFHAQGPSDAFLYQALENWDHHVGKTVTLSVDAKVGADGAVVEIDDGVNVSQTTVPVASGFQRVSVVHTVDASADKLAVRLFGLAAGSYFDNATLVVGDSSGGVPFIPNERADDLAAAMRWYQEGHHHQFTSDRLENGPAGNDGTLKFAIPMAAVPAFSHSNVRANCWSYVDNSELVPATTVPSMTDAALGFSHFGRSCSTYDCLFNLETSGVADQGRCFVTFDYALAVAETTY